MAISATMAKAKLSHSAPAVPKRLNTAATIGGATAATMPYGEAAHVAAELGAAVTRLLKSELRDLSVPESPPIIGPSAGVVRPLLAIWT